MSQNSTVFVGDIHGNLDALRGLMNIIESVGHENIVFLGDYLNKGPDSAGVIQYLLHESKRFSMTLLKGNHERILLEALDSENLTHFLKIGGARTINSYLSRPIGPNVLAEFTSRMPLTHVDFLRRMVDKFENADVVASHAPLPGIDGRYKVSAHVLAGEVPLIDRHGARIDTGCGSFADGRLTAFIWPSREYFQVATDGTLVR